MPYTALMVINVQSEEFGTLQRYVDKLYEVRRSATRLEAVILAESLDLHHDLVELVELLPPGNYSRGRFCDQLNSSISGHGWGYVYGTVQ